MFEKTKNWFLKTFERHTDDVKNAIHKDRDIITADIRISNARILEAIERLEESIELHDKNEELENENERLKRIIEGCMAKTPSTEYIHFYDHLFKVDKITLVENKDSLPTIAVAATEVISG